MSAGAIVACGDGKNLIDTVHVDAAAEAHVLALERMLDRDSNASGRPYFITDGQPIECWDWITDILSFARLKPPTRSISLANAYRIGAILEVLFRLARRQSEPPMTRFVAKQRALRITLTSILRERGLVISRPAIAAKLWKACAGPCKLV